MDSDLAHATMTATFADKFPERFFNAGIAEANMIDMAAGLSTMDTYRLPAHLQCLAQAAPTIR